jgi:hypothetical protein
VSTAKRSSGEEWKAAPAAHEKLRALSIRQPWAEQVMRGDKLCDIRSRPTNFRGRIYIYASLGRFSKEEEREEEEEAGFPIDDLPRGLIIGSVELYDCVESEYSDYEWLFRNPQRLAQPLPPKTHPMPVWFHPFGRP